MVVSEAVDRRRAGRPRRWTRRRSRCRRWPSPCPARSRPGRTGPPAGRRRCPRSARAVRPATPPAATEAEAPAATDGPRGVPRAGPRTAPANSSDHARSWMSNRRVRLALVTSVAKTHRTAPVRFHRTHASTVPSGEPGRRAREARRAGAATPSWWPRSRGRGRGRWSPARGQVALLAQLSTPGRGAPVLPDDGPVERLAGRAVPGHDGLALVGDADRGRRGSEFGSTTSARVDCDVGPDLVGIVLDPSRAGGSAGQAPGRRRGRSSPASSTASARTPVVPASIATTPAMRSS